ncbi:PQQ-binding-like beta-propeller repeat protein [bacterium]|nr:PQQ-binding-like beta-propeller repeat protein [bacterium]
MFRILILLLVLVLGFAVDLSAETRTWTDSTGQFQIEAEFLKYAQGLLTLKKSDGVTITVPLEKFSRSDQAWLRTHLKEMRANEPKAGKPAATAPVPANNPGQIKQETPVLSAIAEGDWPMWRGPNGNNIAPGPPVPTQWSDKENILWAVPVPGRGHASPIVVGDIVYVASADEGRQTIGVFAYDKRTGREVWKTSLSQGGFMTEIHTKNSHATPTMASNGKQLFCVFVQNQTVRVVAMNMEGQVLWNINAGPFMPQKYKYGYAPSPTLYEDLTIVAADSEVGWIAAFDQKSGQPRWRQQRKGVSYSSPIVANVAGKDQLLISGLKMVASYDPKTGKPLWATPGTTDATCGTMVWDGDIVFASGGYPDSQTIAVKGDGSGQVLWANQVKCYEQSMLASDGYVYAVNDKGIFYCWDGRTGQEMWKERLGEGAISASPLLSGENIFVINERGNVFILKASPSRFQPVATNQLGNEVFASPVVSDGRMYVRFADSSKGPRQEYLMCIGQP